MDPDEFIRAYEAALATQDWNRVEPLVSHDVCVTFSNGTVYRGKNEVQRAFEGNFSKIKSEKYTMKTIDWLRKESGYAVYLFEFNWTGIIADVAVSGSGVGTSVIVREDENWKLLTEHLGKGN